MSIEVIGSGLGRTGTTSLKKALEMLLGGHSYHMEEVVALDHIDFWLRASNKDPVVFETALKGYKSIVDVPGAMVWEEILAQYPDAKIVLTVRSAESWFESSSNSTFMFQPDSPYFSFFMRVQYWTEPFLYRICNLLHANWGYLLHGDYSKENAMKVFNQWNDGVKLKCPPSKLLVFDVKQGWEPLCKFLNKPIPDIPFPRANDSAEFQSRIVGATSAGRKIFFTAFYGFSAGVLASALVAFGAISYSNELNLRKLWFF